MAGLTHDLILVAVCVQDLGTQIFYWDLYKSACRHASVKRTRMKYVTPNLGEWMAGQVSQ